MPGVEKSLYLSDNVFCTVVLIEDTVNKQTNIANLQKLVKKKKTILVEGRPVGYLQGVKELNWSHVLSKKSR